MGEVGTLVMPRSPELLKSQSMELEPPPPIDVATTDRLFGALPPPAFPFSTSLKKIITKPLKVNSYGTKHINTIKYNSYSSFLYPSPK